MQHSPLLHRSGIDWEQFTAAEQERMIELLTELLCLTLAAKHGTPTPVEEKRLTPEPVA